MKFFAAAALLLMMVSVSSAKEQKEARAKGHEKASRSALYNGGLSNAHQEKYRLWPHIQYGPSNADRILIALNQILRTLQNIQAQLGITSDDHTDNPPTIESETTDEPTTPEPLVTEVSSEEPELSTPAPDVANLPDIPEVQTSERSHSNSASRAHSKSHSSKAKSHGKSKNHAKGHSKHAKSHSEKKN